MLPKANNYNVSKRKYRKYQICSINPFTDDLTWETSKCCIFETNESSQRVLLPLKTVDYLAFFQNYLDRETCERVKKILNRRKREIKMSRNPVKKTVLFEIFHLIEEQ